MKASFQCGNLIKARETAFSRNNLCVVDIYFILRNKAGKHGVSIARGQGWPNVNPACTTAVAILDQRPNLSLCTTREDA